MEADNEHLRQLNKEMNRNINAKGNENIILVEETCYLRKKTETLKSEKGDLLKILTDYESIKADKEELV